MCSASFRANIHSHFEEERQLKHRGRLKGSTSCRYKQGPANRPSWPWSYEEKMKNKSAKDSAWPKKDTEWQQLITSFWRTCFDNGDELELKPEILSSIYLPASESVFHALNIIQHVDGCS
jgi:hypothetical protein